MRKHMLIASTAILLMTGCTNMPMGAGRSASSIDMSGTDLLAQTQLPPGARILHDQSMVIGSGNNWVGRVVIDSAREPAAAFSYFLDNYPTQGWTLLSAVRAKTSVMVFTKQEHNVTIEIQESNMLNGGAAIVILTRAPRNANDLAPSTTKIEPTQQPADITSKP
jgi:uncharacterized protein YcfL